MNSLIGKFSDSKRKFPRSENRKEWQLLIGYTIGMMILFLIIYGCYQILLISIDDIEMRNIISGTSYGSPNASAIYIMSPLSRILAKLYVLFPCVSWYEAFLFLANWGALWILYICAMFKIFHKYRMKDIFIMGIIMNLSIFALWGENLINLEWTVTSAVMSAVSIALFIFATERNTFKNYLLVIVSAVLFLASYNLRKTVAYMAAPVLCILFLGKILKKEFCKPLIVYAVIMTIGAGTITLSNHIFYSGETWDAYFEYNEARAKPTDYYGYPNYKENKQFYKKLGITENQLALVKHDWNYTFTIADISTDDYIKIAELSEKLYLEQAKRDLPDIINKLWNVWKNESYFLFHIFNICLIFANLTYYINRKKKIDCLINLGIQFYFIAMWCYLLYKGRLPQRVGIAICAIQTVANFAIWISTKRKPDRKKALLILASLLFVGVLEGVSLKFLNINNSLKAESKDMILEYTAERSENVYFRDNFLVGQYPEFFSLKRDTRGYNLVTMGGWIIRHPLYEQKLKDFGFSNPDEGLKNNDNIYLIREKGNSKYILRRWEKYCKESKKNLIFKRDLACTLKAPDENEFKIYHIRYLKSDIRSQGADLLHEPE